jgi:hypothetical protein
MVECRIFPELLPHLWVRISLILNHTFPIGVYAVATPTKKSDKQLKTDCRSFRDDLFG